MHFISRHEVSGDPWEWMPRSHYHSWWRQRERFVLAEGMFDTWALIAAEAGSFFYEFPVTGERGEAGFGDLILCPPGVPLRRQTREPLTHHVIYWEWQGPDGPLAPVPSAIPVGKITLRDVERLSADYALLRPLANRHDKLSSRRRDVLLSDLLHLYYAQTAEEQDTPLRPDDRMREASRLLQTRAPEVFSMKEISDALGLSPVQFTRRFRAAYGQTPSAYLTVLRLDRARALLLHTDYTLQRIAEESGFASGNYLSRVFARTFQQSPGRFRALHRF